MKKRYTGEYMAGADGKTRRHDSGFKTTTHSLGEQSADAVLKRGAKHSALKRKIK